MATKRQNQDPSTACSETSQRGPPVPASVTGSLGHLTHAECWPGTGAFLSVGDRACNKPRNRQSLPSRGLQSTWEMAVPKQAAARVEEPKRKTGQGKGVLTEWSGAASGKVTFGHRRRGGAAGVWGWRHRVCRQEEQHLARRRDSPQASGGCVSRAWGARTEGTVFSAPSEWGEPRGF